MPKLELLVLASCAVAELVAVRLETHDSEPAVAPTCGELPDAVPQPPHGSGTRETLATMGTMGHAAFAEHVASCSLPSPVV